MDLQNQGTVNSQFKKDRFLDSVHKSFLNQTTLDLRTKKWNFLKREFIVV